MPGADSGAWILKSRFKQLRNEFLTLIVLNRIIRFFDLMSTGDGINFAHNLFDLLRPVFHMILALDVYQGVPGPSSRLLEAF